MQSDVGNNATELETRCLRITKPQEAENDKYRILTKFGFNHGTFQSQPISKPKNKAKLNNNHYTESEKSLKKIGRDLQTLTQQTTANASTSSLIKINTRQEEMFPIEENLSKNTFSISKESNQSNRSYRNRNINSNRSSNDIDIQTEKKSRNENIKDIHLKANIRMQESFSKSSKESSYGVGENMNEIGEEEQKSSKTNYIDDNIIKKEIINENTTERNEYKNELMNLFRISNDNMYNISLRIVNDEYNDNYPNHHKPPDGDNNPQDKKRAYSFISSINQANEKLSPLIKHKNHFITLIAQMSNESLYELIFHSFDMFNLYFTLCKDIRRRILSMLSTKFSNAVNMFKEQYSSILKVESVAFKSKAYFKNNKLFPIFDLVISSEIIAKDINQCYDISYEYNHDSNKYLYTWKFDIRNKTKFGLWFTSEIENYNQSIRHHSYTQPISSYSQGDIIKLHLNVFSFNHMINPSKIRFLPPVSELCPNVPYEKMELIRKDYCYDSLRSCEIEKIVHFWKDISQWKKKTYVPDIIELYKDYFDITDIQYDVSQFYYFRYKMTAKAIGVVKRNRFFFFDIQIVDYNDRIENETQCLGILNLSCFQSKYMIRLGTDVSFYCIEI